MGAAMELAICARLQLILQDHASHVSASGLDLGRALAIEPEEARIVPDLVRLHPTRVVGLSVIALGVAVPIQQPLARLRQADDAGVFPVAQAGHRPLAGKAFAHEGSDVSPSGALVAASLRDVVDEHGAEAADRLERIDFGAAQHVGAAAAADRFTPPAGREPERVTTRMRAVARVGAHPRIELPDDRSGALPGHVGAGVVRSRGSLIAARIAGVQARHGARHGRSSRRTPKQGP
jgi:hypothetical protein